MKYLLFSLVACILYGCGETAPTSQVQGPLKTPPPAASGVSTSTETIITSQGNAAATGDKVAIIATRTEAKLQTNAEFTGATSELALAGVVVAAVGVAAYYEFGAMIGGGVIALGAALIILAMTASALYPYRGIIACALIISGICYEVYKHLANVKKLATSGELLGHIVLNDFKVDFSKISVDARMLLARVMHFFKKSPASPPVVSVPTPPSFQPISSLKV